MGLITREVEIKWHNKTKKWYESKGYTFTKINDNFIVKVEDLLKGSHVWVEVKCDCNECESPYLKPMKWQVYMRYVKEDGTYFCMKCAKNLYAFENMKKTVLNKTKSFEQWCVENNRLDVLDRWDYDLNNYKPREICYGTGKKYYFKCPRGIHKSELKQISWFTSGQEGSINCKQCNSFAQWGMDNIGTDFLEKYWDYEQNIVNPWEIDKCSGKKVWIKCQEKEYHGSYYILCSGFVNQNQRCSFCVSANGKVHILDSLGILNPEVFVVWSDKNKKSPYEYSPMSNSKVWWKCQNNKHIDYLRDIKESNYACFRCPECQFSKGEKIIEEYLLSNNISYTPQKTYQGLVGINNGLLSYDFYLHDYNLLIEYQGEFHDGSVKNVPLKEFEKQVEHDRRKKEYANKNNIKLLEIWYYDFDKIEEILQTMIK